MRKKSKIGEILIDGGHITKEDLDAALQEQEGTGEKIGNILVAKDKVSVQSLGKALEEQYNIPYVNIAEYEIQKHIAQLLSEDVVRRYTCLPIKLEGNWLYVALPPPIRLKDIEEIKLLTGLRIRPLISTHKELIRAINEYYSIEQTTKQAIVDMRMQELSPTGEINESEDRLAKEDPVVTFVDSIITGGVNAGASDIHFEPQYPEMRVRYRVDGVLHDVTIIPKHVESSVISRIKVMADMDIAERRLPQDGHISIQKEGKNLDIRASTMLTINGEKVVMRIFDKDTVQIDLEDMGLSESDEAIIKSFIDRPQGMILVTGPTGSGKTTTLYSALRKLDPITKNIITIENPVEYRLEGINQIQTNPNAGITFATALRTLLRQDPDVIMVGEIRDPETADIAIKAALTGHLVLSTLHTNDAPSAITRLADMEVQPYLIADSISGIVAQRLARVICPDCKEKYEATLDELRELNLSENGKIFLHRGKGCKFCFHTGYKGRTGIFEVLRINEEVKRRIVSGTSTGEIKNYAVSNGMTTLTSDAQSKVLAGITTVEEVKRTVYTD